MSTWCGSPSSCGPNPPRRCSRRATTCTRHGARWSTRGRADGRAHRAAGRLTAALLAADLGLDADALRSALESGRYTDVHQQALGCAGTLNITAVPTFVVDDRRIEGMASAEQLARLIDG